MKTWMEERLEWMDSNMVGNCEDDISTTKTVSSNINFSFSPNPAIDNIILKNLNGESIVIHDAHGKKLISTPINGSEKRLDLSTLSSGIYFITEESSGNKTTKKLIIL